MFPRNHPDHIGTKHHSSQCIGEHNYSKCRRSCIRCLMGIVRSHSQVRYRKSGHDMPARRQGTDYWRKPDHLSIGRNDIPVQSRNFFHHTPARKKCTVVYSCRYSHSDTAHNHNPRLPHNRDSDIQWRNDSTLLRTRTLENHSYQESPA
jgi:hypothetical protein